MNITSGKLSSPQRGVFYGPEGVGKTTLAASLPNPVFIDLEDGTKSYDVRRAPRPQTFDEMLVEIEQLSNEPLCQTIVVDTADAAEKLCTAAVLKEGGKDGIEDFGYGKGYTYLAEKWQKFLNALRDASARKHIIICAHAQITKFELPGQVGQFDRFSLKLSKQLSPMTREWADCVLFINFETLVTKDKATGKATGIGGKERLIHTMHCDAYDAKNRHDLPEELPCEYASIASVFPAISVAAPKVAAPIVETPAPKVEAPKVEQPAPKVETPKTEPVAANNADPLAWFADYEQEINVKLLAKGWIQNGQTWRDLNLGHKAQLSGTTKAKMAKWCGFELKEGDR